jgi:hypothetical protein
MWQRKDQLLEFKKSEKSDIGVLHRDATESEIVILHHLLSSPLPYYRVLSLPCRRLIIIACYLHHDIFKYFSTADHIQIVSSPISNLLERVRAVLMGDEFPT